MKKLKLLSTILIGILIFSCSSDDNNSEEAQDPIVGIWKFNRAVDFYNETEYEFSANECSSQGRQTFESNGIYSFTVYGQQQSDCINEFHSTSGSWIKNNDEYQISYEYECIGLDCNDETPPNIILIDNNTLRIQYNGEIIGGELTEYYYREYTKE